MGIDTSAWVTYGIIVDTEDLTPAVIRQLVAAFSLDVEPPDDGDDDDTQGSEHTRWWRSVLSRVMNGIDRRLWRRGLAVEWCGSDVDVRWVIGREAANAMGDGDGGGLATTTPARIAAAMRLSKRQRATIEQLRRIIPGASKPRLVLGVMRWQ